MNIAKFYIRAEYFLLGLRDRFGIPFNPREELNKLDIKEGQIILDYGCGIGSYTFPIAKLVGNSGRVYALDKEPVAVTRIEEEAKKQGLRNIITILSDRETSLRDDSVDVVLFYGVLPEIKDKESVLKELHRVLKRGHILNFRNCNNSGCYPPCRSSLQDCLFPEYRQNQRCKVDLYGRDGDAGSR